MNISKSFIAFALVAASSVAWGLEEKNPRVFNVQGDASVSVAADAVRLSFSYPTEDRTFEETAAEGKGIADKIQEAITKDPSLKVKPIYGWDLIRQAKISWGQKGRTINQKISFEVENIPAGKLHKNVAAFIDGALKVNDKIQLDAVEVYLSEEAGLKARESAIKVAAKRAHGQAKLLAEAMSVQLGPLRFISTGMQAMANGRAAGGDYMAERMSFSKMEVRQSFKVPAEVTDMLEIKVSLWAVYEIK